MTVIKPRVKKHTRGALQKKVAYVAEALRTGQPISITALAERYKCTKSYVYYVIAEARKSLGIHKAPRPRGTQITTEALRKVLAGSPLPITMEEPKPEVDMVNHPPHYTAGGIETIDFIQAKLTPEEFRGYLRGNILKYSSRAGLKHDVDPLEDLGKLVWYANKLKSLS